jgi:uncharacterized protein (TIGR01370 family)
LLYRFPALLARVAFLLIPAAALAVPNDARLAQVHNFAFALGDSLQGDIEARLGIFDLVVIDAADATAEQVALLQSHGTIVLGYLSVGTIERGRFWYTSAKPYRLRLWSDWNEWYADVNRIEYRHLIAQHVVPRLLRKNFDDLFLDNVDMITAHPRRTAGMRRLVHTLSDKLKARAKLLFAQNGDTIIDYFSSYLDGWNREDISYSYDFESEHYVASSLEDTQSAVSTLQRLAAEGLLVLSTDYVETASGAEEAAAKQRACEAGALPFISDIDLTRMPATPFSCDSP